MKQIDTEAIRFHIRGILEALGDDPDREGLKETPDRVARIADMVGKRLQLQERIGSDIADIICKVTGSEDVAVFIEGCHSCMTARGIKKTNTKTYTQTLRGRFSNESNGFMQWWR